MVEIAATRVTIVDVAAECEQFGASGTVAMNPKNGQVLPGKPVTLSAKPGKDTVFAYWLVDGEKVGYTASYKYEPSMDSTVTAVFRLKSSVEDPVLDVDSVVQSQSSMVGVAFEMSVPLEDAAYPAKFTASKLPAGLKIDAASGAISGVPTKAGKYSVAVTAAGGTSGKSKSSVTLEIDIAELPLWAQGTFTGYVHVEEAGDDGVDMEDFVDYESTGFATMTVAANGKVSGKVSLDGVNWTFGAVSYDAASVTGLEDDSACVFVVKSDAKAGKVVKPIVLEVRYGGEVESLVNGFAEGEFCGGTAKMWRGIWKDKATAAAAKRVIDDWQGIYTVSLSADEDCGRGYLSLTVGKDGNVKATGKLADGTSVSATSPLMYDVDTGWLVMLYAVPSAYKGGAFALTVGFNEPQGVLGDAIGVSQWTSRNAEATAGHGEGFSRVLSLTGAYYNKLKTLHDYYESMRFELGDVSPMLAYTYKNTSFDDNNRKVTESWIEYADAVEAPLQQEGMTVTVNEKGAIIVEKATKPVQDKVTKEWSYEGKNDGGLSLSFAQATGIFKGSYTFWYDYDSAFDETTEKLTQTHISKKVNFEGILVQGVVPLSAGFYLWDAVGEYEDTKTGKTKTYKYNESYTVILK